jgi:biotin carboxylase
MHNSNEDWLIAVTAGRWQQHGILEAKKAGFRVLAVDGDSDAVGMADADLSLSCNLNDSTQVLAKIDEHNLRICGVVSFCSEAGMNLTGKLRDELCLPGPGAQMTARLTDKGEQRNIWQDHGVPGPAHKVADSLASAIDILQSSQFPVILKPCDSAGSRGVSVFKSVDELSDATIQNAFAHASNGRVIIEGFMDGLEHTVEMFSIEGQPQVLAVTEKRKIPGTRGTVAMELSSPTSPAHLVRKIEDAAKQAISALGYQSGPSHCEVILMADGKVGLVEVAGRGGGFNVFDKFIPAVSGINIARLTALAAAGRPINSLDIERKKGVLRFFPTQPGKLLSILGFHEANLIRGVDAAPFANIGEVYGPPIDDGSRLGYILSVSDSLEEALHNADLAESKVTFSFEPNL